MRATHRRQRANVRAKQKVMGAAANMGGSMARAARGGNDAAASLTRMWIARAA
jgi:hypothetical protein